MTSPEQSDGTFRPIYNEFYGTDEERIARDNARRKLQEGRQKDRPSSPRQALSEEEVKAALADIGIEL